MHFSILGLLGASLAWTASATPIVQPELQSRATNFNNPVLWQDHPDLDVFRVGDVFYYSSSTFAFSPGAPVLKSYDLVNWTPVSHSVPRLDFASKYNLNSATDRAYVKGIWASSLQYRKSDDTFYWIGCIEGKTYVYTSTNSGAGANNGEVNNWNWSLRATLNKCYYDCGLFFDDNDTVYVAYGNTDIQVAQLSSDARSEVRSQSVYKGSVTIEGSRMYKVNGNYYIFVTRPANEEWVLKASSPFGPYTQRVLVASISGPLSNAGFAHQGGIVGTKDNKWYYMGFMDAYPGGRIPVSAPITWGSDGFPVLTKVNNGWGQTYPTPVETSKTVPGPEREDSFTSSSLSHEWEWNHNPDTSKFTVPASGGGIQLSTATVTNDLFTARNTLTHRILGPKSHGTFRFDISKMADGDRAGAALFRDVAAYIGIYKEGSSARIVMVNNLSLNSDWSTKSTGTIAATGPTLPSGTAEVWLRVQADITPAFSGGATRTTTFLYSVDGGNSWTQLGGGFGMTNTWQFFTGYRFAAFNHATKSLGGSVVLKSFALKKW
ncbi:unnamed protein product [Periconia digitata]|uniref:Beta-xylosidase C-terminal Concanavalin A-like domain-containing protein n=1 Tax=Periconia digitata TaxID=1303443 RepID=A0A9W4UG27_9PLEO|nr:unnamed protein product [Periconia digitata]